MCQGPSKISLVIDKFFPFFDKISSKVPRGGLIGDQGCSTDRVRKSTRRVSFFLSRILSEYLHIKKKTRLRDTQ